MRLVTVSTALALSLAALSLSTPASAVTVKKQPVAKPQRVASVAPVKKAAVAPAKKVQAVKHQRAVIVAPAERTPAAKKSRISSATLTPTDTVAAFDRHGVSDTADFGQQMPQNVHGRRAEKTESTQSPRMPRLFASSDPVSEARRWIGSNPTDRNTLWCARFMNFVLERSGFTGTGSDAASSFASYGRRVSGPQVGAIAVMTRGKNGGHVGIVSGIDEHGNPIVISGNNYGRKVGESVYSRSRIYAYVMPQR